LTRKLLSFGRKQVLLMDVLDLNEIIASFEDIMRTTVRESISIELRLTPEPARVLGDRGQMEQILLNLAVNAQDAIPGGGAISLETGHLILDEEFARQHPGVKPGPYVLLAFSDDGCGMNEETLRHIYEPFFTTKEVGRGTGLGLASVYGIVKQHEGYIDVWSRPGEGTSFKIFLPMSRELAEPLAASGPDGAAHQGAGEGKTILLVEDDAMIREMAEDLLKSYGYRTLVAALPSEALDLAAGLGGPIDLLVSDVVMPQMNGPELHERLLESQARLPVLYISGYTGNVVLHKDTLEMETTFLTKPFTLEQFLERIRQILAD
jgi:two-component system, cell cycle sensor histidine kinase and response regulator CckA